MTSDRTEVVKAFRQQLNNASFGLGQVNDNELETWLFCPGPDRVHLLQWCLGQLNPDLRKRFQDCDEQKAEKRTVEHVITFGVSNDQNVILGTADPQLQIAMWKSMLLVIENSSSEENSQWAAAKQVENSIAKSKDFTDLLCSKIKLVPTDLRITPSAISEKKIEQELKIVEQKLEELQETLNVSSGDCDNDDTSILEHSVRSSDDYKELFCRDLKKIQECYQHLEKSVFPAIRRQPENPIANALGSHIENLADNVTAFVQMLKDTEAMHRMSGELQTNQKASDTVELRQCISKCHSCASEILSLWRLHNMT